MQYLIRTTRGTQKACFRNNKEAMRETGKFIYNTGLEIIELVNTNTGDRILWTI